MLRHLAPFSWRQMIASTVRRRSRCCVLPRGRTASSNGRSTSHRASSITVAHASPKQRPQRRGGTTPGRSFVTRINVAIGRHVPARAEAAARYFSLGDPARLRALFEAAGFREVETAVEERRYAFPSFDAWFGPIERGAGTVGAEYAALPEEVRRAVREDVRRELEGDAGTGGPVEVPVEILFAAGCR